MVKQRKHEPWYTEEELFHFLKRNKYCDQIAMELAPMISKYANSSYRKGLEHGLKGYNPSNVPQRDN